MPNELPTQNEPICALATPSGRGALATIRLSGDGALAIANGLTKKTLSNRKAIYTKFTDKNNEIIDHGIAIFFKAPASFTGEDVVEFQCHGNPIISDLLLKALCEFGARMATPGEFTLRAFLNNKIDLAQAEAIADLISSTTEKSVRTANRSLQGEFSKQVDRVLAELVSIRINVEAHLDFPDEEIDAQEIKDIKTKVLETVKELEKLQQTARRGERLHTGATIAIAGKPNVGKSSLINTLAQSDIAIVTEIPGTTRDPLTADVDIHGVPVQLIDTAGLRDTDNVIENLGIERTLQVLSQADIILWLTDASCPDEMQDLDKEIQEDKCIRIYNKIDLIGKQVAVNNNEIHMSAKTGDGLEELVETIAVKLCGEEQGDTPFLARRRHLIALQETCEHLKTVHEKIGMKCDLEIVAEELRLAQHALGEITGEFTAEDLLGRIFSDFCIGK